MLKNHFKTFPLLLLCGCVVAVTLSSQAIAQDPVTLADSVIPKMESVESIPPNKYSERYFLEIQDALKKSPQKIRVVSYNILFDLFDHQLEEKTHSWQERLPRVIKSIENMKPDVLCVQEPYSKQLQDLKKHLENTYDCFVGTSTTGELNAVFYKKERFELDTKFYREGSINLSSASHAMPLNPKDDAIVAQIPDFLPPELEPGRQMTLVHLRDRITDKSFVVLNTHLTYYRVNSREDQALYIQGLVRKLKAMNKPVILAGDFNTVPNWSDMSKIRYLDGNHIEQIFQEVLRDTKDVALLGHIGPLSTFTKDFLLKDSKPFENIGTPGVILDHIYVSSEFTVLLNAVEPSRVDGHFPSDHMPVIADVLLP